MREILKESIYAVFTTGYYAATDGIKNSFFPFAVDVITHMIHSGVLNETLHRNIELWARLDAFMETLIGRVVNLVSFLAHFSTFVKQRVTKASEEELSSESKVA